MNEYVAHVLARSLALLQRVAVDRQSLQGRQKPIDPEWHRCRVQKGVDNFEFTYGGPVPPDATMLEFGTGAHGIDLQLAYVLGMKRMITVDITNHLDLRWVKSAAVLGEFAYCLEHKFGVDRSTVTARIRTIVESETAEDFLERISCTFIRFHWHPIHGEGNLVVAD